MAINARVGIKSIKSYTEANRRTQHILRLHGPVAGSSEANVQVLIQPAPGAFSTKNTLKSKDRRDLQKKRQYLKKSLKKLADQPNIESEKYQIIQKKLDAIDRQMQTCKLVSDKRISYVELVLTVTNFPPHDNMATGFGRACRSFIQQLFSEQVEIVVLSVHLDQASLHTHVLLKIKEQSWSQVIDRLANPIYYVQRNQIMVEYAHIKSSDHSDSARQERKKRDEKIKKLVREEKKPFVILSRKWHHFMSTIFRKQGIKLEPLKRDTSKSYLELPHFKAATIKLKQDQSEVAQLKDRYSKLLEKLRITENMSNDAQSLAKKIEEISCVISDREKHVERLTQELHNIETHEKTLEDELLQVRGEQDDEDEELRRIFRK